MTLRTRRIAVIVALCLPLQPIVPNLVAIARPSASNEAIMGCAATVASATSPPPLPAPAVAFPAIALPLSASPAVAMVPLSALPRDQQRRIIADQLVQLGHPPDMAERMSSELTVDDLAVLLDNPKMMQKAGEIDQLTMNIIWALLIAGAVVAIVIAADGSIAIN